VPRPDADVAGMGQLTLMQADMSMGTTLKAVARFVTVAAVSVAALMVASPAAVAAPNCDWNTDAGTQACMGGGPFGGGDTYGPTGEAGFVHDTKRMFPQADSGKMVKLGYEICADTARGTSRAMMKAKLMKFGIDDTSAGALVTTAQMYLCPGTAGPNQ
jgi:uncharacterized membrane protein